MTEQHHDNPGLFAVLGLFLFSIGMAIITAILAPSSIGPYGVPAFFLGLMGGLLLAAGLELIIYRGK